MNLDLNFPKTKLQKRPHCLHAEDSLCSSSVMRWLTVSRPWLIFSCWPCVSFLIAWRSFSNILIFLSSSPSRSSTLHVLFARPGGAFDEGLEAGEAGEAGRRPPGGAPPAWEGAPPAGGVSVFAVLPCEPPPALLLLPRGESVRFSTAGPISACNRAEKNDQPMERWGLRWQKLKNPAVD